MNVLEHPSLPGFELQAEAEAGVYLTGELAGGRWWGTRIRYRQPPARRWHNALLVDVHPFDTDRVAYAVGELLTGVAR